LGVSLTSSPALLLRAQSSSCCGANLQQMTNYEVAMPPPPPMGATQTNPCYNMRETTNLNPFLGITDPAAAPTYLGAALANSNCTVGGVIGADVAVMEQSGTNVTLGYRGTFPANNPPTGESLATAGAPISTPYYMAGLCPVNVHWHLGSEHLSVGQARGRKCEPCTCRCARRPVRRACVCCPWLCAAAVRRGWHRPGVDPDDGQHAER
jgi:hypothetical protein